MKRLLLTILTLFILLLPVRFYTQFKESAAPIPPGVHLGGLELSGATGEAKVRALLAQAFAEPIAVYLDPNSSDGSGEQRFILRPDEVGFTLDVDAMLVDAAHYLQGPDFVDIALRHAVGLDQRRRDVPLQFDVDGARLGAWLDRVGRGEQEQATSVASARPARVQWLDGAAQLVNNPTSATPAGYVGTAFRDWQWIDSPTNVTLDREASAQAIVGAMASAGDRVATLVVAADEVAAPSMADLQRALDTHLSTFPGFAAVYVKDLRTGESISVDADVAFSGMSTLKIGIVAALFQQIDGLPAGDAEAVAIGQEIEYALGDSNNQIANRLVRRLGDGDAQVGMQRFTNFMRELGFESSYMQSLYEAAQAQVQILTPGNQREDWNTNPDPGLQSTPREMGELMVAIYECTQGDGLLIETFGDDFTPDECETILFYIGRDEYEELLWAGLPEQSRWDETWIVHKHGFAFESHSDVALVWGPTGPYVLSVFFFREGWMDWETSNGNMKAVSRITWNFFELLAEEGEIERPAPPSLEPPDVYVPIGGALSAAGS